MKDEEKMHSQTSNIFLAPPAVHPLLKKKQKKLHKRDFKKRINRKIMKE